MVSQVDSSVSVYNRDARAFLRSALEPSFFASLLAKRMQRQPEPTAAQQKQPAAAAAHAPPAAPAAKAEDAQAREGLEVHVLMNLPESAIEFLGEKEAQQAAAEAAAAAAAAGAGAAAESGAAEGAAAGAPMAALLLDDVFGEALRRAKDGVHTPEPQPKKQRSEEACSNAAVDTPETKGGAATPAVTRWRIHCYAFSRNPKPEEELRPRVEAALGCWPHPVEILELSVHPACTHARRMLAAQEWWRRWVLQQQHFWGFAHARVQACALERTGPPRQQLWGPAASCVFAAKARPSRGA
ncbi:hypothetical protein Esti_005947 [Eimeria stiedai]